jgi:Flp pilus assembly protein TadB
LEPNVALIGVRFNSFTTNKTRPEPRLFPCNGFTVASVDWAVYAALIAAGLAVVAAAVFVVVRSLQAWRDFKRFRRQLGRHLDQLADAGERTAQAAERVTDSAELTASVGRLRRSLGRLAVLRAALDEATGTVTRFSALYPRK